MRMETERLVLRDLCEGDFEALHAILSDEEIMRHYPHPFCEEETRNWIKRNRNRYEKDGFGLWAVELKETGQMIGDCGITMQNIHGKWEPEIGYHITRSMQKQGYATEGAAACMKYAFEQLHFPRVYSYMKYTNSASARVAQKNGMHFVEEYADPVNTFTRVYAIDREEWEKRQRADFPGDI